MKAFLHLWESRYYSPDASLRTCTRTLRRHTLKGRWQTLALWAMQEKKGDGSGGGKVNFQEVKKSTSLLCLLGLKGILKTQMKKMFCMFLTCSRFIFLMMKDIY